MSSTAISAMQSESKMLRVSRAPPSVVQALIIPQIETLKN